MLIGASTSAKQIFSQLFKNIPNQRHRKQLLKLETEMAVLLLCSEPSDKKDKNKLLQNKLQNAHKQGKLYRPAYPKDLCRCLTIPIVSNPTKVKRNTHSA